MESAAFHVVYVDKRISGHLDGTYLQQVTPGSLARTNGSIRVDGRPDCFQEISSEITMVRDSLHTLLINFDGGMSSLASHIVAYIHLSCSFLLAKRFRRIEYALLMSYSTSLRFRQFMSGKAF